MTLEASGLCFFLGVRFSEFPQTPELQAPLLGEHNVEVLGRHPGYSRAQVEELESKGVIAHEMS